MASVFMVEVVCKGVSMLSHLKLYHAHDIDVIVTRKLFSKIVLYLNKHKVNVPVSNSRSLNEPGCVMLNHISFLPFTDPSSAGSKHLQGLL